ncbi:MAG: RDD family protein [Tenericutes bacterium]|nr:RDD family protein [Mycoplasmatota bacterium]
MKATFLQRLLAYLVDAIFVTIIASFFAQGTIDSKKSEELVDRSQKLIEKYVQEDFDVEEAVEEYKTINYENDKLNYVNSIITLVISATYYIGFCYFNKGQTVGKKLMKIRIKSRKGELKASQVVVRALILNNVLILIVLLLLINFVDNNSYYVLKNVLTGINYVFLIISTFMILYRKDKLALQDVITNTMVVRENKCIQENSAEEVVKEKENTLNIETIDNAEVIKNTELGENQEIERK